MCIDTHTLYIHIYSIRSIIYSIAFFSLTLESLSQVTKYIFYIFILQIHKKLNICMCIYILTRTKFKVIDMLYLYHIQTFHLLI